LNTKSELVNSMNKQRRYPGTKPFSSDQKGIFFGRSEDIAGLAELVNIEQLTVLYSKSGLGKSSLINAGVLPKLEKEDRLIPYSLRFGAYTANNTASPLSITTQTIGYSGETKLLDKIIPKDNSLWYHLKSDQIAKQEKRGYLLIFDQFEELFTYPEAQIAAFGKQLAELLYTTIPERFRKVVESEIWEKGNQSFLSEQDQKDLHKPLKIKILMAIRSDRMSLMNRLKDHLPHVLKNCYELLPLSVEQAEDAILIPAFLKDSKFESPPFDYDYPSIAKVLDFLTDGDRQDIASFQLQILCEYLEKKVIDQQLRLIQEHHLGDIKNLFKNYYDDQIATLGNHEEQLAARKLLEEALIFEEEERRLTLYEGIILKSHGMTPELLRKLLDSRLLRSERSTQGEGYNYEISHDSLVAPILKSKEKRIATEEQNRQIEEEKGKLEEERQRLLAEERERQKHLEIEQKKKKRNRRLAMVGFVLSAISIVMSIWALSAQNNAKKLQLKAESALENLARSEEIRRSENFERFRTSAQDKMNAGDYAIAQEALEAAMSFTIIQKDKNTIQALLMANQDLWDSKLAFDAAIKAGEIAEVEGKDLEALNLYTKAKGQARRDQDNQMAEAKIALIKKELEPKFNKLINNAQVYDKIGACDLVRKELRQANQIRKYLNERQLNKDVLKAIQKLKCN
jgi:hypothetical protein